MQIALVTSKDSALDILPELKKSLEHEIINVEVELHYAKSATEIPATVSHLNGRELIFAFCMFSKNDFRASVILQKLIDLEIQLNIPIVKGIEISEETELQPGELDAEKPSLAAKWLAEILQTLFPDESKGAIE